MELTEFICVNNQCDLDLSDIMESIYVISMYITCPVELTGWGSGVQVPHRSSMKQD